MVNIPSERTDPEEARDWTLYIDGDLYCGDMRCACPGERLVDAGDHFTTRTLARAIEAHREAVLRRE